MTLRKRAHQLFLENRIGSLESGKDADIAVWDRDPYSVFADDLTHLKCERTLLRGKVGYHAVAAYARGCPKIRLPSVSTAARSGSLRRPGGIHSQTRAVDIPFVLIRLQVYKEGKTGLSASELHRRRLPVGMSKPPTTSMSYGCSEPL